MRLTYYANNMLGYCMSATCDVDTHTLLQRVDIGTFAVIGNTKLLLIHPPILIFYRPIVRFYNKLFAQYFRVRNEISLLIPRCAVIHFCTFYFIQLNWDGNRVRTGNSNNACTNIQMHFMRETACRSSASIKNYLY